MTDLTGAIVALTGSGSGLGLGLAQYFRECGARLALLDISADKVASLKEAFGEDTLVMQGDVRDIDALKAFRDATAAKFGGIDCLVGAQGIFDGNRPISDLPVEKIPAAFDEVMQINVLGYILSAVVFREELAKRNGSITLTASSNASYCADGGGLLYTASKHSVLGVVRQLAFEFAPDIRVNAVSPGLIWTEGIEENWPDGVARWQAAAPLVRLGMPDDVADACLFLASPGARWITGANLRVDGGVMATPSF